MTLGRLNGHRKRKLDLLQQYSQTQKPKRWSGGGGNNNKNRRSLRKCSKNQEKFPYNGVLLCSRLLHSIRQHPGTCHNNIRRQLLPHNNLPMLNHLFYLLILCLGLDRLSLPTALAATQDYRTNAIGREICSSLDIRNNVDSFKQLNDCEVIEGFLQIVLMDKTNESDFANLTFPNLREITGYLLLYRVNGLKSLAILFPNLSVIRGQDLFINYALAVYEMLHLQELGLHSLTDIARGYVFVTKNPLLCYVDTINWSLILNPNATDANLILENRQSNACPKCINFSNPLCAYDNQTKQSLCWNAHKCQKICPGCNRSKCTDDGKCCYSHCLGGCSGTSSNDCYACEKVVTGMNQCVSNCPNNYFEFKDRRCISASQCYDTPKPKEDILGMQLRPQPYKPHLGKCIIECPHGYEETGPNTEQGHYTCEKCKGACRKVCDAANVDSIQSAQRLKGCVIINGSLEIQIRGGGNIIKELEDSLIMIEEITGYLKVVRSISLVSLNFLRRLKSIHGENLENGKYALVVLDNPNLAELWDFSRRDPDLVVRRGRMFFHFNPKLCYSKIIDLQKKLEITPADDMEVAPNSNGDKVACNITTLHVSVANIGPSMALVTWVPYIHYELRTLLGYVVYYMEASSNVIVSMNDGRDGCGGDGWATIDVEVPDPQNGTATRDNVTMLITHLKPYTRYAYYVKTYTIATEPNGAQSQIQYFRTYPSTPTPPRQLKITSVSSSEVKVEWQPPEQTNGNLIKYIVSGEHTDGHNLLDQRNYCTDSIDLDKKDPKEESRKNIVIIPENKTEKTDECACKPTEVTPKIKKNDQEIQALIEFENKLHDNIYVKIVRNNPPRTRRRANFEVSNLVTTVFISNESKNLFRSLGNETSKNSTTGTSFRYEVSNSTLKLNIQNLKHFSEYSISVQACREKLAKDDAFPDCSSGKMENIQTLALDDADKIDPATVELTLLNDTSGINLKWQPPNKSNGHILTYVIQYKRVEFENQQSQTQCVPRNDFEDKGRQYQLKNLPPGNYSVMIRATTLARDTGNNFTPPRYFFIKEKEGPIVHQLMLGALFAVFIIIMILVILLIILRYFYPDSWYHRKLLFATVNPEYFKPIQGYDKWEISRRKITFDNLLGMGHFGEVYEGRVKGIMQKGVTTKVAIKTISKLPSNQKTWTNFLHEASVMKQFTTHHVVKLLGVVTVGEPLVIMELMGRGDLRTYLRCCREDIPEEERKGPVETPPTLEKLLQMAAEIADGMLYLSDKKFVHRDLAARNCMMNMEGTVKIGDFGLTRDVYEAAYYRRDNDSKGHLPVRWMSPESLRDGLFHSQSDVWSYGVVLWEMITLASLPYAGLGNGEVMPYVINGGSMEIPENCPVIISKLMRQCWQFEYNQRPSFAEILILLMPHVSDEFANVSYFHTEDCIQVRSKAESEVVEGAEAAEGDETNEEPTSSTPVRVMEDFEDFSLDSDDEGNEMNHDGGEVGRCKTKDKVTANYRTNSPNSNMSIRNLPAVNGYIRRLYQLLPPNESKTTPC